MKKLLVLLLIALCAVTLCACSAGGDYYEQEMPNDGGLSKDEGAISPVATERKVYYTVEVSMEVEDVAQTASQIKSLMQQGEWIASESQTDTTFYVTLRIKTERIDSFIASLGEMGRGVSFSKQSTDVTEQYLSNEQQIASLNAEKLALERLYQQATDMSDILTINQRLSEVNSQLQSLSNQQNKYDSLVDYSIVTIYLHTPRVVAEDTFGARLLDGLAVSWEIAQSLVIFILCLLPFAMVIGGIVVAIVFACKRKKNKKQ